MGLDDQSKKAHHHHHHQQRPTTNQPNQQNQPNHENQPHLKSPKDNIKFRTIDIPKTNKTHHHDPKKYATAPSGEKKGPNPATNPLDKKIFVSLISQSEYMKRHLYIKSGVDRDRPNVLRYQVKKVSLRNYTPKTIDQDVNMGMWI